MLFAYYGSGVSEAHAVVIDGDFLNYFHFAAGRGGFTDAYYYLFDFDASSSYNLPEYYAYYKAAIGIEPNCPTIDYLNLNNITINIGQNVFYHTNDRIDMGGFIIDGNSTTGGRVTVQAKNEVNLQAGFEVKVGGEAFITTNECD